MSPELILGAVGVIGIAYSLASLYSLSQWRERSRFEIDRVVRAYLTNTELDANVDASSIDDPLRLVYWHNDREVLVLRALAPLLSERELHLQDHRAYIELRISVPRERVLEVEAHLREQAHSISDDRVLPMLFEQLYSPLLPVPSRTPSGLEPAGTRSANSIAATRADFTTVVREIREGAKP